MIREAIIEDRPSLIHFVKSMIGDTNKDEVANQVVNEFYNDKSYMVYVTELEGTVVGFAVYKRQPFDGANGVGEIVWLSTLQEHKRRGLARDLISYIERLSNDQGIRKLYVKTSPRNKVANCFWIMQGYEFEVRMRDFSGNGIDDYYLAKYL